MANEFKRDNLLFSLCGLNCSLCPLFVRKECTGCIEGSMCYKICFLAPCSIEHGGMGYCFECGEYPCDKYEGSEDHDSLITHINQKIDMEKAQKIGIEKYNEEQSKKVEILHKFLENYNPDNNKEVFFCTAVNLLPLDDLTDISNGLDDTTSGMSLKEKYDYLKNQLFECGNNHNIKIELRKGKYNEEKISFE